MAICFDGLMSDGIMFDGLMLCGHMSRGQMSENPGETPPPLQAQRITAAAWKLQFLAWEIISYNPEHFMIIPAYISWLQSFTHVPFSFSFNNGNIHGFKFSKTHCKTLPSVPSSMPPTGTHRLGALHYPGRHKQGEIGI